MPYFSFTPLVAVLLQTCNANWQEGVFPPPVPNLKCHWSWEGRKGQNSLPRSPSPVSVVYLKGYFPFFMPVSGLSCIQTRPALLSFLIVCPEHGIISDSLGVLLIKVAAILELTSSRIPHNLVREIGIAGKHWGYPHSSFVIVPPLLSSDPNLTQCNSAGTYVAPCSAVPHMAQWGKESWCQLQIQL